MYVCGATVQSPPHLGHVRFAINFDLLRRWLLRQGYAVRYVRNVTDVEDKVMAKATEAGLPWWELAYANERAFSRAYDLLGCLPVTYEPRATGHIPQIISLIQRLIDRGAAYPSAGDVLFDVGSFAAYGELSGQRPDEVQAAEDSENPAVKRDSRDFVLWKAAKPGEPSWQTPWGAGRPGWHIECSAMAVEYLGSTFDIHGGGVDLVFPHHENEIAQAVAAGDEFARYWMHNAWVTMAGEKMSKSLGNTALVSVIAERYRPVELRFYLASPHYRSTVEYSTTSLDEAAAAYRRLESFVLHAREQLGAERAEAALAAELPDKFVAAMNDDLSVPQALAVVYNTVREGNSALAAGEYSEVLAHLSEVRAMLDVLGLDPLDPQWRETSSSGRERALTGALDSLIGGLLEQREQARAAKDWASADAIRDRIRDAGVEVTDGPDGPRWSVSGR